MSKEYIIAIDIAKNVDRTAITIGKKEFEWGTDGRGISFLNILDLQMIEHMTYPDLVAYVKKLDMHTDLHGNNELLIDSTGVGEAVCDMLGDKGLNVNRIIFTGGDNSSIRKTANRSGLLTRVTINVPKHELVDTLHMAMQEGRIRIAKGIPFEADIRKQFSHFVGVMNKNKNVIYNNDSDSVHDDIVCSFSMMAWWFMQNDGARKDFRYSPDIDERTPMRQNRMRNNTDYDFVASI